MIRVLIADDQELIRTGLAMVIGAADGMEVAGEARDGIEAMAMTAELAPDVVLMDVQMPRLDGIDATREIVSQARSTRVIILTTFDVDAYAFGALEAGASGFLLKDSTRDDILAAVRAVASGDAVLTPRVTGELMRRYSSLGRGGDYSPAPGDDLPGQNSMASLGALTEREVEVFLALADGLSNNEIAQRLWVSESTVKTHVGRILHKLGMRDRVQAVVFAFRNGVI